MKHVAWMLILVAAGPARADLALELELSKDEIAYEGEVGFVVADRGRSATSSRSTRARAPSPTCGSCAGATVAS